MLSGKGYCIVFGNNKISLNAVTPPLDLVELSLEPLIVVDAFDNTIYFKSR